MNIEGYVDAEFFLEEFVYVRTQIIELAAVSGLAQQMCVKQRLLLHILLFGVVTISASAP